MPGTRFLATDEMSIDPAWKDRIVLAAARDAIKVAHAERVLPPFNLSQIGQPLSPRRTLVTCAVPARSCEPAGSGWQPHGWGGWPHLGPASVSGPTEWPDRTRGNAAQDRNSATTWDNIALGVALNTAHQRDMSPPSTSRLLDATEGAS